MNWRKAGDLPSSKTLTRYAQALGREVWHEYKKKREEYKGKGLTPREACERSSIEMNLVARWKDWHERKEVREAVGSGVPLTPGEVKAAIPSYVPPTETRAESVGDAELSFAEEVIWARDQRAMVENGSDPPTAFPSKGALSWYQYALVNREKFMQFVATVSKGNSEGEDLYLQDGQYTFKEIGKQIEDALQECGEKLLDLEGGFAELLVQHTEKMSGSSA
jgi:hypothetical protein